MSSEREWEGILENVLMEAAECEECGGNLKPIKNITNFEGYLTRNRGICITFEDGEQLDLTIVQREVPRDEQPDD